MANSLNPEKAADQPGPARNPQSTLGGGLTTVALIVTNCVPVLGVLLWGWDVGSIVTLYWAENLILGVLTLLRMLRVGGFRALGVMAFFSLHYGMFCAAHGILIIDIFDLAHQPGDIASTNSLVDLLAKPIAIIFDDTTGLWWWAFAALCISHGLSFVMNFLGRREFDRITLNKLMSSPYGRILVLHVTVLLGGLAVEALGAPVYLLLVLIAVKIFADSVLHRREHVSIEDLPLSEAAVVNAADAANIAGATGVKEHPGSRD